MQTTTLADQVREYVDFTREIYESREWMNVRSALARLVQHADEITTRDVRHALDCLQLEHNLSPGYRRSCWTRWRRFLRWAVEHELAAAELLVHVQAWLIARWTLEPTRRGPDSRARCHRRCGLTDGITIAIL